MLTVIYTYFGGHWPLVLLCWISPERSISKRGRVRSKRDVIYWFLTAANLLLTQRRKLRTTVFRRQNSTCRKRFLEIGLRSMLRSLIRILRASLVQIDAEMTNKYSNQRYAVDALSTNTQCPIQPDIRRESRFCLPHLHLTHPLGGGGSRRNIDTPFGTEKLEWCGYSTVKKFRRYVYSFRHDPRKWQTDRQTDGRTPHADIGRA